jgi:hypothetical protein
LTWLTCGVLARILFRPACHGSMKVYSKLMSCVTMWPALASLIIANARWIGGGDYGTLTVTMTPWVLDFGRPACRSSSGRFTLPRTCGLVHAAMELW